MQMGHTGEVFGRFWSRSPARLDREVRRVADLFYFQVKYLPGKNLITDSSDLSNVCRSLAFL